MRVACLTAAAIFVGGALATGAAAQGATGFPMGDVGQVLRQHEQPLTQWTPPPGPLKRLPRTARAWIRTETGRQVETPRRPIQVLLAIESALAPDVMRLSKRERIRPDDIQYAILMRIMLDAEAAAARDAETAARAGDPALADAAAGKLARASANRAWAGKLQSANSLYMAAM